MRHLPIVRTGTVCLIILLTLGGGINQHRQALAASLNPLDIKKWPVPGGTDARPYGMTVDNQNRVWFVETGLHPNRLLGFDIRTRAFMSLTEIPSGGGTVRHMFYHHPTQTIWFGTDANTIGRAKIP